MPGNLMVVSGAQLDGRVEVLGPQLLVDFDVLDVEVDVAVRQSRRVGRRELGVGGSCDETRDEHGPQQFHGDPLWFEDL
jgi:hypothetical protein